MYSYTYGKKLRCKQCDWKSPTQQQRMNSAVFKGIEAADTTALSHKLAAGGCKTKKKVQDSHCFLNLF